MLNPFRRSRLAQQPASIDGPRSSLTFTDPATAAAFWHDGYVVGPSVGPEALARLRDLWDRQRPERVAGMYTNVNEDELDISRVVSRELCDILSDAVHGVITDGELHGGAFMVKAPGLDSVSRPHQDWNNVDEERHVSMAVWCPLVDTHAGNGALEVIPGSHRIRPTIRSLDCPTVSLDFGPPLDPLLTRLDLPAGGLVLYSHALIHGSRPNRSEADRPAAVCGLIPRHAPHVHYRRQPGGSEETFELLSVTPDFFYEGLGDLRSGRIPSTARSIGTVAHPRPRLEPNEVIEGATAVRRSSGT